MARGISDRCSGTSKALFLQVLLWLVFIVVLVPRTVMAAVPSGVSPATFDATRIQQQHFEKPIEPTAVPVTVEQKGKPRAVAPAVAPAKPAGEAVKFTVTKVIIEGSTVYPPEQLASYYSAYLGKQITLTDLQKIADDITARYRKDGYVISRAVVPAQKIVNGVVVIKVFEGYISEVFIEGDAKGARSQIMADAEKIKQMRPLQIKNLERYVLLLNDLPGLTVKSVLAPSPTILGAAELTFITEQKKIAAEVSYDNRGTRYLGPQEVVGMLEIDDFLHLADRLVVQTVDTPTTDELRFLQVLYNLPLGSSGLTFNFNGSFAETNPGFILTDLDLRGRSKNWSVGLDYPIIRSRSTNLLAYGKFEWLDSYTNFVTEKLFQDHIRSLRVGGTYNKIDKARGMNTVKIELSKGLKVFGASALDPVTPLSRFHGRSDYTKATADVSRLQAFGKRFSLLAAVSGQYSFNQPLLSAEQFAFGGAIYGRGYDAAEIIGDSGVAGKLELRMDTNPDLRFLNQIQYYLFYDIGKIWNVSTEDDVSGQVSGTTTGAGLRANLNRYLYANLEAAKPLTKPADTQELAGHNGKDWRFYFAFGLRY